MIPSDFEWANVTANFSFGEDSIPVPAYETTGSDGERIVVTLWKLSKEDMDAVIAGGAICLMVRGEGAKTTVGLYTINQETGKPNV